MLPIALRGNFYRCSLKANRSRGELGAQLRHSDSGEKAWDDRSGAGGGPQIPKEEQKKEEELGEPPSGTYGRIETFIPDVTSFKGEERLVKVISDRFLPKGLRQAVLPLKQDILSVTSRNMSYL
ncbi:hypothetical protein EYF80_008064 [Liparis tanakae]|uniref:Uncharacterized protein n=1 Tax=Liparis tanakae TaxID=230148 RepID=A0A4Z2IVT4_9TELE|nr:hypothetical protein EYF80_008064 [Liparis tanakae]